MFRIDLAMDYASLQGDISRGRVLSSGSRGVGGKTDTAENEREGCVWAGGKVSRDDILTSHPHPTYLTLCKRAWAMLHG